MSRTILILSTQYPGYGGAATNAYALIKYLRENNYKTIGIFIEDNIYIKVDPDKIGNVFRFGYHPFKYKNWKKINEYKKFLDDITGGNIDLILCKNYVAPVCSKILYPNVKNFYLVSGLTNIIENHLNLSVEQMLSNNIVLSKSHKEIDAINNSDLIVVNSPLSLKLYHKSYYEYQNKIHPVPIDTTKYISYLINNNNINMISKKYDFIIVSTILTRPEKNNLFLLNILKKPIFNKYTKLIIGKDNLKFKTIPNSYVYNLQPHSKLMELMKESKLLLYPSLCDSNPNTIREALHNKCLVLISNNIGYYEKIPDICVCTSFSEQEWIKKCLYLVENYDNIIGNCKIDLNSSFNQNNSTKKHNIDTNVEINSIDKKYINSCLDGNILQLIDNFILG